MRTNRKSHLPSPQRTFRQPLAFDPYTRLTPGARIEGMVAGVRKRCLLSDLAANILSELVYLTRICNIRLRGPHYFHLGAFF